MQELILEIDFTAYCFATGFTKYRILPDSNHYNRHGWCIRDWMLYQ